jgi:hypothetical protein
VSWRLFQQIFKSARKFFVRMLLNNKQAVKLIINSCHVSLLYSSNVLSYYAYFLIKLVYVFPDIEPGNATRRGRLSTVNHLAPICLVKLLCINNIVSKV